MKPAPTLIRRSDKQDNDRAYFWVCLCHYCGKEFLGRKYYVLNGRTVSCGCFRRSGGYLRLRGRTPATALKDPTESSFNYLYRSYLSRAKGKIISFELSKDKFKELVLGNCFYCGATPSRSVKLENAREAFICNGVDRKDPSKGYTLKNSVSCCSVCNYMKLDYTEKEFIDQVMKIARNTGIVP